MLLMRTLVVVVVLLLGCNWHIRPRFHPSLHTKILVSIFSFSTQYLPSRRITLGRTDHVVQNPRPPPSPPQLKQDDPSNEDAKTQNGPSKRPAYPLPQLGVTVLWPSISSYHAAVARAADFAPAVNLRPEVHDRDGKKPRQTQTTHKKEALRQHDLSVLQCRLRHEGAHHGWCFGNLCECDVEKKNGLLGCERLS